MVFTIFYLQFLKSTEIVKKYKVPYSFSQNTTVYTLNKHETTKFTDFHPQYSPIDVTKLPILPISSYFQNLKASIIRRLITL